MVGPSTPGCLTDWNQCRQSMRIKVGSKLRHYLLRGRIRPHVGRAGIDRCRATGRLLLVDDAVQRPHTERSLSLSLSLDLQSQPQRAMTAHCITAPMSDCVACWRRKTSQRQPRRDRLTSLSSGDSLRIAICGTETTAGFRDFQYRTVPEWNSLPEAYVNADTITAFQTQLHRAP